MLLTVEQFREHSNTDAPDSAIERLLSAEEAAIARVAGPVLERTITIQSWDFRDRTLFLGQPALSILSVVEDGKTLQPDEYRLVLGGNGVQKETDIFHTSRWGREVTLTYIPADTSAERIRVLIYLVKLGLAQDGYDIQRNPEFQLNPGR